MWTSISRDPSVVSPGFEKPAAGAQSTFRAVLEAMAHPGRVVAVPATFAAPPPAPLGAAAAAVALSLLDADTPLWTDHGADPALGYLRFHCGCPTTDRLQAALFALVIEPLALPPLSAFNIGTDEFPDRSATLILEVAALQEGFGARLSGPGIRDRHLRVGGLPEQFWTERVELQELFPRGLDVVLTCGDRLAALPRTTRREDL